jgi:hypothetical protein
MKGHEISRMVSVKPGHSVSIDFTVEEAARAEGIESGVVVAAKEWNIGTLSYLLPTTEIPVFVEWITGQVSPQAKVYLVGGHQGVSESYLDQLRQELELNGFNITKEDTMSRLGISKDLQLYRSGRIEVEHYTMRRTPTGEMRRDTIWINILNEPTESKE